MPLGREPSPLRTETPAELRARAACVRHLARGFDDLTIARMKKFAHELEDRAAALEQAEQAQRSDSTLIKVNQVRPPASEAESYRHLQR